MRKLSTSCLLIALLLLGATASRASPEARAVVGVNLLNAPDKLSPAEQESILSAMQKAGVTVIRVGIADDATGDERGIDFAARVHSHGILMDWLVDLKYPKGVKGPKPPPGMGKWRDPPLSQSDPAEFRFYFERMLGRLEAKGIRFAAFELGNEINFTANSDFPMPGTGRILGPEDLRSDSEGRQVAAGFSRYLQSLAVLKQVRDNSRLNRATPIVSSGLGIGNNAPGRSWSPNVDGVSINATLQYLRDGGLDRLVDFYGVHTYPPGTAPGSRKGADMRLARLENIVFTQCRSAREGGGKPCWLTEWGFAVRDDSCPVDDTQRSLLVREMREDFRRYIAQGRLKGIFYFEWQGFLNAPHENRQSAFLCGQLTDSGREAIAPE